MIIRIIVWIIGLVTLYSIFLKFRAKQISFLWFSFWFLIWAGIIVLVSHPQIADMIAKYIGLGKGRGVEFFLFLAIIIFLYLIFRLYLQLNRIESDISEIVKNIALFQVKKRRRKR